MNITPEFVQAEIAYRLERAETAALTRDAREGREGRRPSRFRRWLTGTGSGSDRTPVRRHVTPALP